MKKKNLGFSLLEIIAAIFIVTMGMVGVLTLVIQNIQVQYINKNNIIASQLAQEGLELVRNVRDNNWLAGNDWDLNLDAGSYKIDYTGNLIAVSGIDDAEINKNGNGFFGHFEGESTIYRRLITITQPSPESLNVVCQVQWNEKAGLKNYMAETILYNWR